MNLAFDIFPAATPLGTRLVRLTNEQLHAGSAFRVELSGLGFGIIVINRNQPECTAANFADDNFVQVFDLSISDVVPLGGFFLDNKLVQVLSLDEEGGEIVQVGGPGALSYFGRCTWWNTNYVNFGQDAQFGPRADGSWWWYQDQYGDILKRAIDEAKDSDRPAAGRGIPDLTYDFSSTLDSAGAAWDTFSGDYSLPVGTNYLEMVQKFRDVGLTIQMSGELVLQAFQGFYGTDRTSPTFAANKVRFVNADGAAGANILEELRRQSKLSLKLSRVLVKGDTASPTSMVTRTAGAYNVVREGFVQTDRSHAVDVLEGIGDQAIQLRSDSADVPTFRHLSGHSALNGLYTPFLSPLAGFPTIVGDADGSGTEGDNFATVPLPSSIVSGELLLCSISFENATTFDFPAGWTEILDQGTFGPNHQWGVAYRIADGTEGATIEVDLNANGSWYSNVLRIINHGGAGAPPEVSFATGNSSTPDAPNHTPTGGSQKILWIANMVSDPSLVSHPSGYTVDQSSYAHGWGMNVVHKQLEAASENPPAWALSTTRAWGAATISVRPGATTDYTYWVGDLVTLHTGTEMGDYTNAPLRVYAINWKMDEKGSWWPQPELGGLLQEARTTASAPPSLGGGGGGGVVSVSSNPPTTLKRLLTNKSGGTVVHGDVVVVDPANDESFTTSAVAGETRLIGVAQGDIANNATGYVAIVGYVELVNVSSSVTRGHYGFTHSVAKQAAGAAARTVGAFCQFLKGGTTPSAILFGPPDAVGVIAWKQPVRAAATAAGTLASSFENGDTIDGVVLATGDRILIKDQAAGAENGIYTVNASGAPTRATDFDLGTEAVGAAVVVTEGTANADKVFICTTNAPITLGTTALAFAALSAAAALIVQEDDTTVDAAVSTIDFRTALNVTSSPAGEANVSVDLGTGVAQAAAGNHGHAQTNPGSLNLVIGNGVDVIPTGVKMAVRWPFAGTIVRNSLLADVSGSIVVDIWKDTYANFPPTVADTITASAKPTLASAQKSEDTTLTGWTTGFSEGDIYMINVDSASTVKRVTLELKFTRS